jgi:hypothetical protein
MTRLTVWDTALRRTIMNLSLTELFQSVQVKDAQEAGGLQVFGLRWDCPNGLSYSTLDEALSAETLDVTEIHEQGCVPKIKVTNRAASLVFLMAGEQLVGAKQNRVLNASIMVPAQSELHIPVSCVEAGSWSYRSRKFASLGTMAHGLLRKVQSKSVMEGYRHGGGGAAANQGEVWSEVARKLKTLGSISPSHALDQAYADHKGSLHDFEQKLSAPGDCNGAVFVVDGQIAGADLFDKPATLGKLWPKLIRAFALDVLECAARVNKPVTADAIREWLRSAGQATTRAFKSPGLGQDVRLEAPDLVGAGLVVDERPVHVELFPDSPTTRSGGA